MKPLASTIQNTGNLEGKKVVMGIALDDISHIMSVLTNLYKNPLLAVLREYATNALDAHRAIGLSRAIKVSLPTRLNPTLIIEDFGVGMTTDEIISTYSQYGASTKRDTNEQTGMLGLGSKSALAVTSQFTVRSRKGGVETSALIYLNDRGEGEIRITDTKATDLTGTQITIPVKHEDVSKIETDAMGLFRYWSDDLVDVKVDTDRDQHERVSDNFTLAPKTGRNGYYGRYTGSVVVVQGNVPYVVNFDNLDEAGQKAYNQFPLSHHDVIVTVPIGTLQFTPSREELYYTNHTNNALAELFAKYPAEIGPFLSNKVETLPDRPEVLAFVEKYEHLIPQDTVLTYRGEVVPSTVECTGFVGEGRKRATLSRFNTLPKHSTIKEMDVIVYNVPESARDKQGYTFRSRMVSNFGESLREYYSYGSTTPLRKGMAIAGPLPENWEWYGVDAVDWKEYTAKKLSTGSSTRQGDTDYQDRSWESPYGDDGSTRYGQKVVLGDVDGSNVVYYTRDDQHLFRGYPNKTGNTYVLILGGQVDRFQREYPEATSLTELAAKAQAEILAATTKVHGDRDKARYSSLVQKPATWKGFTFLDPDLTAMVEFDKSKDAREKVISKWSWIAKPITEAPSNDLETRYGGLIGNKPPQMSKATFVSILNHLYTEGTK